MTIIQTYFEVQKNDLEEEFFWVLTIEPFEELGEGIKVIGPKDKIFIDNPQSIVQFKAEEVLFKETCYLL